jgi:putative membrane protein
MFTAPGLRQMSLAAALAFGAPAAAQAQTAPPSDAQIAHIAYTAGALDVAAGRQALAKSKDAQVRAFAEEMVRDHAAVNDQALALVKTLRVTPQDNPTSQALSQDAAGKLKAHAALDGAAFDKAYVANEIAFHRTVNRALASTLIPNASNAELKGLLQTGLKLFTEHQHHAEHLAHGQR